MSSEHCKDNGRDRATGAHWEDQFCRMAAQYGFMVTPHQLKRSGSAVAFMMDGQGYSPYVLPDVTIWHAPGQHHELKHKYPTQFGAYGLEQYRFAALMAFSKITEQDVLYTIHHNDRSGAQRNRLEDWYTVEITALYGEWIATGAGPSWVNGEKKTVPMYYWPTSLWRPLVEYWREFMDLRNMRETAWAELLETA